MRYKVLRIDEDIDFGCEERPEGVPVMAVVTLQDEDGKTSVIKAPDQMLYERRIEAGDMVTIDGMRNLQKAGADIDS